MQLFQAIDDMPYYNEKDLKEKFKGKAFIRQLHVAKNYLSSTILQSLVAYHYESSAQNTLAHLLQTIEILYDKELHNMCLKQIEKGIKICREYDKKNFLFVFLEWQTRILMRRQEYNDVLSIIKEQTDLITNLQEYLRAKEKAVKIHHRLITKGFPRSEEDVRMLKTDAVEFSEGTGRKGSLIEEEYYRLFTLSNFYGGSGEPRKRTETIRQLIGILEKNMNYSLEHPQFYISALNNYYNALVHSGQIRLAKEIFHKIRSVSAKINPKRHDAKNYALLVSYDIELEIAMLTNETHNVIHYGPRIKEIIEKAEGVFQKSSTLELIYNTSRVFFIAGEFSEALDWVNMILNEKMTDVREDLNTAARILYLIIHFELGNEVLLRNIITSTKNSLKYKKRLYKAEQIILDSLQKLNEEKSEKHLTRLYEELASSLDSVFRDPSESKPTIMLDLSAWISSKLTEKPMGKIVEENYLKEISNA